MAKKPKYEDDEKAEKSLEVEELTNDIKRIQADFENYKKRADLEKSAARQSGEAAAVLKLLPVIDSVERATNFMPEDIQDHPWVQGVVGVIKNFDKSLNSLGLERVEAKPGTDFNPEIHDAVHIDEDAMGEREVVAEELQPGYLLHGRPIRHAMVKVTRA